MKKDSRNIIVNSKKKINIDFEKLGRYLSFVLLFLFIFSLSGFSSSPADIETEIEVELLKYEEIDSKTSKKSTSLGFENKVFKANFYFVDFYISYKNELQVFEKIIFIKNIHLIEIPIPPPEYI